MNRNQLVPPRSTTPRTTMSTPAVPIQNYGSIAAVPKKEGNGDEEEQVPLIVAFETDDAYPEATQRQKEILKLMDRSIHDMKQADLQVQLPLLTQQDVQGMRNDSSSLSSLRPSCCFCTGLSLLLGATFRTLLVTIFACCGTIYYTFNVREGILISEHDFARFVLPGMVAILGFVGSSYSVSNRLWNFSCEVVYWNRPTAIETAVKESVEEQILMRVASHVDHINMKLSMVLDEMKSLLILPAKDRKRYLKVDPTLPDLPTDPISFVDPKMGNAKSDLQVSVLHFLQDLPVEEIDSWIPSYLKSSQAYYSRVVTANLFTFFVLHLVLAYGTFWVVSCYYPSAESVAETYVESTVLNAIDNLAFHVFPGVAVNVYIPSTQLVTWSLALSCEAYLFSSCFLLVTFGSKTSCRTTVNISNQLRSSISEKTNAVLRQAGILFLCRDILQIRMGRTKRKLLKLIHYSYKLEMLREIVDGDAGSVATSITSMSSLSPKSTSPFSSKPVPTAPLTCTDSRRNVSSLIEEKESISRRWRNPFASWRVTVSSSTRGDKNELKQ